MLQKIRVRKEEEIREKREKGKSKAWKKKDEEERKGQGTGQLDPTEKRFRLRAMIFRFSSRLQPLQSR